MPENVEFQELIEGLVETRAQIAETLNDLVIAKDALQIAENDLAFAIDNSLDTADLLTNISDCTATIADLSDIYADLLFTEGEQWGELVAYYPSHQELVEQLDDSIPILFFPVRIETTFVSDGSGSTPVHQLWVRIFPDDIEVQSHESQLTQNEFDEGKKYWDRYNAATTQQEKVQAWNLLCEAFNARRAAWIALNTTSSFTSLTNPKADSWTQQPFTQIFPDNFVIKAYPYSGGVPYIVQTNKVPDIVKVGIDPQNKDVFVQDSNGDITADPDVAWLIDFDEAIAKGLGVKINISANDAADGFARIKVIGVKISLTKEASQARLEDLINSHHYTDGFSLLKQGTSVNNTDTEYSGYSSVDFGNPVTHATEREANLFTPSVYNKDKRDGQILCEALGIEYDPLYHIFQSNGTDIHDVMNINNALWQSAWGYYFGNLCCPLIDGDTTELLRQFFIDFVYCRGALPSIRSGIQPYGILPATVYSRMVWAEEEPNYVLYSGIFEVTNALAQRWDEFAGTLSYADIEGAVDILAQSPVSVNRVFRIGVGAGYVWNNLAYSRDEENSNDTTQAWYDDKVIQMNKVESDTGIHMNPRPRIAQMTFLEDHFSTDKPLVAPPEVDRNGPLPLITPDFNYMSLLSQATFEQLKYADYSALGLPEVTDISLLYLFTRNSLMLEYFTAACKLLNLSDEERIDPELVNMPLGQEGSSEQTNNFQLYQGGSRWEIMSRQYGGYATISEFLDSSDALSLPETANLFQTKESVYQLASNTVGELELLTTEVCDAACYRLDTWRLSLVNQRINKIRGITDGSSSRNKGIYLGAYSWVEDVVPKGQRNYLAAGLPTANFTGPIETDSSNFGYIHAPSISQATTAAILRSGYMTRAKSSSSSPLSVNLSSERVRNALQILEGVKNGQSLSVLLGYEFERRLQDNYPYVASTSNTSQYLYTIRNKFPLNDAIVSYNNNSGTNNIEDIKSRSVTDGVKIIEAYKTAGSNINTLLSTYSISIAYTADVTAIKNEIEWIWNLMDAVSDLTTAEGVFQTVQSNQVKSGGITEAAATGKNISNIEVINTPKTGLPVYQRFTMHFDSTVSLPTGWSSSATVRAGAEPYFNKWIGDILGSASGIKCTVHNKTTNNPNDDVEVSLADLDIQPIDLIFMINDELEDDDSELSMQIKAVVRDTGVSKSQVLEIAYDEASGGQSLFNIFPLIKYLKRFVTSCRHLKTQDYLVPNEADGIANQYDVGAFYTRLDDAYTEFVSRRTSLANTNSSFSNTSSNSTFGNIRGYLAALHEYGLDKSIYEFNVSTTHDDEDYAALKAMATAVVSEADKRIAQYTALAVPDPNMVTITNQDEFIALCIDAFKILFGREFNVLPQFDLDSSQSATTNLSYLINNALGTLRNDHSSNSYLVDEWISSISKVRKNAGAYEMLSILSAAINMDTFVVDREVVPLQVPYANDNTERWLGASVLSDDALKEGRVAFGVSVPKLSSGIFDITAAGQVGVMIDEWIDVIPNKSEISGVAFHFNQPNNKAPQCLLLGVPPEITGHWKWQDIEDMINETLDFAKQRAFTYEALADQNNSVTQCVPAMGFAISAENTTIGLAATDLYP